ncbi:hypothetical protein NS277_13485 [Novosphingobium barchaimii]|nr:hypothetical protein NS277_13485 [Novosphingobium barchaimii]
MSKSEPTLSMPSTNKVTHYRRSDFKGPRRRKPRVRALNDAIRAQVDREHELVQLLTADAQFRETQVGVSTTPDDALAVWWDFDQFRDRTNIGAEQLPRWTKIGDYLKFHLLLRACLIFGGYAFTARVRPDLEAKWLAGGRSPVDRVGRLISKGLLKLKHEHSISNLAFCYVVEGKGRRGQSRTALHVHGVLQTDDPLVATLFNVMLGSAFAVHAKGRAAAGISPKSGRELDMQRIYDSGDPKDGTAGRWATYFAKNLTRPEKRLPGKRTYISSEGRRLAREMWDFMRQEDAP